MAMYGSPRAVGRASITCRAKRIAFVAAVRGPGLGLAHQPRRLSRRRSHRRSRTRHRLRILPGPTLDRNTSLIERISGARPSAQKADLHKAVMQVSPKPVQRHHSSTLGKERTSGTHARRNSKKNKRPNRLSPTTVTTTATTARLSCRRAKFQTGSTMVLRVSTAVGQWRMPC